MDGPDIVVESFRHGPFWNFSYLLASQDTREAVVIDPAWDPQTIIRAAEAGRWAIRYVLLTHSHTDHINGVAAVAAATGASVLVHAHERDGMLAAGPGEFTTFAGMESLRLGSHEVRLLPSPGHSEGSIVVAVDGRLFTGDTLHVGGVGRPGPYGGSVAQLGRSIRGLVALGSASVVHPGHDEGPSPTSTLGLEIERVPALHAATPEEFAAELQRATGWRYEV